MRGGGQEGGGEPASEIGGRGDPSQSKDQQSMSSTFNNLKTIPNQEWSTEADQRQNSPLIADDDDTAFR